MSVARSGCAIVVIRASKPVLVGVRIVEGDIGMPVGVTP